MRKSLSVAVVAVVVSSAVFFAANRREQAMAADAKGPMIVHDVYFALKENTPEGRAKLVAACKKYLSKHPGTVFFAAGTLAEDLKRPVNDREWDVGLHVVFEDKAAHDKYQEAELHLKFIAENKENWKKVRVFDTTAEK